MKLSDFIKLINKHKVILIVIPLICGLLTILLTSNPKRSYYSQTTLYTGIASGSSIEMDKSFNYLATNNAFDNLIYIIKSRETREEVAIRLLSRHLILKDFDTPIISESAYKDLREILPEEIKSQLSSVDLNDENEYKATLELLKNIMLSNNTNFVYSLLNFDHPYYSLEAISKVKAERISSSDLVKFSYETDDPGICQQTLAIYIEVCIEKYKILKENGSNAVVEYFQIQLKQSEDKLKRIEKKLLKFNEENNIINYYEQSKAIAVVKEEMSVDYGRKKAQLEGSMASAKRLEKKLEIQQIIQEKNTAIIDSKKQLGEINYRIGLYEAKASDNIEDLKKLSLLKKEAMSLQNEIKINVDEIYAFQNSIDGVPVQKALPDWVDKVVETEDLKAKIEVMSDQNKVIDRQLALYAPAGANLKRIEREIEVAEQEYIEILHGLNLANLKFQDAQLATNLKTVDPPYYPLQPVSSKRKIIILAVLFFSGFIVLGIILMMEYFDDTLKNDEIATNKLGIPSLGVLSKVFYSNSELDLKKVQNRLMEFLMQNLLQFLENKDHSDNPKVITVVSTRSLEGKSVLITNLAKKFKNSGKSVLVLTHCTEIEAEIESERSVWLFKLFGYPNPLVDRSHPFLEPIENSLDKTEYQKYRVNSDFKNIKSYLDFKVDQSYIKQPDVVIIELPNLLETDYPTQLLLNSDITILICRANRLWEKADDNILNNLKQLLTSDLRFVINGVDIKEVESLLGELPHKKSPFRGLFRNVFNFQFRVNQHI